jgi:hypothetical protein
VNAPRDPQALQAALRAGAAGYRPEEAAIDMLLGAAPAVWRDRAWQDRCVQTDRIEQDGGGLVLAEVDWAAAVEAVRGMDVPAAQVAVVQIAADLAAGPLGAALGVLEPEDLDRVLAAVAHAVQDPAS